MKREQTNPLLCDVEKGICEIQSSTTLETMEASPSSSIQITYFTDPTCSSCWGIEPQLRKLKWEYGDAIRIDYRMGGLLPSWNNFRSGGITRPSDVAHHWDDVSRHYEMPIDGDVWLEDPLSSSYPPSIAFVAARLQGDEKAKRYMRRIREMVFLEKKNISKVEVLQRAADDVGLDAAQFKNDYEGKAQALFADDLKFAKESGVSGFPTLFFTNEEGKGEVVYGSRPYSAFERVVLQLNPEAKKKPSPETVEEVLEHYSTVTTKEFAVLTNRSMSEAEHHLNERLNEGKLDRYVTKNGVLWKRKNG